MTNNKDGIGKHFAKKVEEVEAVPIEPETSAPEIPKSEALEPFQQTMHEITSADPDLGYFAKKKIAKQRANGDMRLAKIQLETQASQLENQADAAKMESAAFWKAKSLEISNNIKTYARQRCMNAEQDRAKAMMDAVDDLMKIYEAKAEEIMSAGRPNEIVEDLMERLKKYLDKAIVRIENETLADDNGLVDD